MDYNESITKLESWFELPCDGIVGKIAVRKTVLNWLAYFHSIYGVDYASTQLYAKLFFVFSGMLLFSDDQEEFEKYFHARIIEQIDKKFYIPESEPEPEENNKPEFNPEDN